MNRIRQVLTGVSSGEKEQNYNQSCRKHSVVLGTTFPRMKFPPAYVVMIYVDDYSNKCLAKVFFKRELSRASTSHLFSFTFFKICSFE